MLECFARMVMKKTLTIILIYILVSVPLFNKTALGFSLLNKKGNNAYTQENFDEIELNLNDKDKLKIEKNAPAKTIKSPELTKSDEEQIKAFQIQKKYDVEDITNLWLATVERNNVIKFALKKVTMNPQERKKHSSKMARTIAALVNGATLLPYAFGLDASIASAIAAGTSLSTQAAKNKLGYGAANIPVTDTELIQLASLIEELQNNLVKNYYSYKSSIELLKDCRTKLAIYKKNYNNAVAKNEQANILVTKSMYENQQMEELRLKNQIKTARIELERFAGEEVVNNLNLIKANELQANNMGAGGEL